MQMLIQMQMLTQMQTQIQMQTQMQIKAHNNKADKSNNNELPDTGNNDQNNGTLFGSLFAALGGLLLVGRRRKTKIMKKNNSRLHIYTMKFKTRPFMAWFYLNTMIWIDRNKINSYK